MQNNSKLVTDPISRKFIDVAKQLIRQGYTEFSPLLEYAAVTAQRELKEEKEAMKTVAAPTS